MNCLQEVFIHKVTKMIELRKEDTQEVLKGWFTPEQMKTELKWTTTLSSITGIQRIWGNQNLVYMG